MNDTDRPETPTPDFRLFACGNGQWCKKVGGRLHYFGPSSDPQAALDNYVAESNGQNPSSIPATTQIAKPAKPHPDYPLYAHRSGQWAKKVRGTVHYFGPWSDPQAALEKWLAEKHALLAGRHPAPSTDGLTIRDLANALLIHKQERVATGGLKARTWQDDKVICDRVVAVLWTDRAVADLRSNDFARLRKAFATGRGKATLHRGGNG